jgi:hypothetical protein
MKKKWVIGSLFLICLNASSFAYHIPKSDAELRQFVEQNGHLHSLTQGLSKDFDFYPEKPEEFTNWLFFPVSAECKVSINQGNQPVFAEILNGKGKVNGREMSAGQSDTFYVFEGSTFSIRAEAYAKVRITNKGKVMFTAHCHT